MSSVQRDLQRLQQIRHPWIRIKFLRILPRNLLELFDLYFLAWLHAVLRFRTLDT